jgi:phage shock protein A
MFDDLMRAWREAVDNFRREMEDDDSGHDTQTRSMQQQYATAREVLERLDIEIRRSKRQAGEERENEVVCRRREEMARKIGDEETVRIAVEFAARHAERAGVLERKTEVFVEEHTLLTRDLESMKQTLEERGAKIEAGWTSGAIPEVDPAREQQKRDFSRLERNAKERAAEERLEELKRKMR